MASDREDEDERFRQVLKDPRFRSLRRKERKVTVDKRFEGMFKEKRFTLKYAHDKRGKPLTHLSSENMKKFYQISDNEKEVEEEEDEGEKVKDKSSREKGRKEVVVGNLRLDTESKEKEEEEEEEVAKGSRDESDEESSEEEANPLLAKLGCIPDARGGDSSESSSSSSSDESGDEEEKEEFDHRWGELDREVTRSEDVTKRLAICNADWDRIKAVDLYVLLNSFKPNGSTIVSVKIYPSEFGAKRMKEEDAKGPAEIVEMSAADREREEVENDGDEEGSTFVTEKLRQYQINRLKYYYAVVECDSKETATGLYDEVDGMEYESSASALDLRFIPDEETFDQDCPSSECLALPDLASYKPPIFINTALQQSKVQLTWDETDPRRAEKFQSAFANTDKAMVDLQTYLASSSSEDDEDRVEQAMADMSSEDEANAPATGLMYSKIDKYKNLLKSLGDDKGDENNLEITWEPNLKSVAETAVENKNDETQLTVFEKDIKKKHKKRKDLPKAASSEDEQEPTGPTNEETDLKPDGDAKSRKKSFKRKKNKKGKNTVESADEKTAELGLLVADDEDNRSHFNYKNYVIEPSDGKRKRAAEDTGDKFKFDANDDRFSAVYSSHLYNIDPSDPHFKQTEAMDQIISAKKKTWKATHEKGSEQTEESKEKSELNTLIRSVKAKTKKLGQKRKAQ